MAVMKKARLSSVNSGQCNNTDMPASCQYMQIYNDNYPLYVRIKAPVTVCRPVITTIIRIMSLIAAVISTVDLLDDLAMA